MALWADPPPPRLEPEVERTLATVWSPGAAFFPTSRWWWASHPEGFGFGDHVNVVHFNDLSAFRLSIQWNGAALKPLRGTSFPSRVEIRASAPGLEAIETKLLTADDVLVSALEFTARRDGELLVTARSPLAGTAGSRGGLEGSGTFHGIPLAFSFQAGSAAGPIAARAGEIVVRRRIAAGERLALSMALGAALEPEDARAAASRALAEPDLAARERERYEAWFARQPQLDCPDELFRTLFLHRIQLARKSIQDPGRGFLRHPVAAEGRWAAKWYAAAIPFGAGHQLAELRWLAEPEWAWGELQVFADNQRGDGAFVGARTDVKLGEYADFVALGAWDLYLAGGDAARFAGFATTLARNADYVLSRDCDGDSLPEPASHWESGMEWQPAYFAFSDYDAKREERIDRVEYACFAHAGALAAARSLELAGRPGEAVRHRDSARRTAAAVEGRMWDASARFYFSLRARDDRMAPDREVPGFYPPGFGITPDEKLGYLAAITDPVRWATPFPVPSVELVSPAYAPNLRWPTGGESTPSMWNGPVWPHALSFVLRSLGRAERARAVPEGSTYALLESLTRAGFRGAGAERDVRAPVIGEVYEPMRGRWLTSERDYFHSTYVDLVVTLLAGLMPAEGEDLALHPLVPAGKWERFALVRVPYHGRVLDLAWDQPGGEDAYGDGIDGFAVWVDGRLAARRADLGPLRVAPGGP